MAGGLTIQEWAEEDRPREKMMTKGAEALSEAELLAILIGSGNAEETAVGLMQRVMKDCENNLNMLGKKSLHELCGYKGLGPAKALTIMAACELGKRRKLSEAVERKHLTSSKDIYEVMHPRMQDLSHEECWILLLNNSLRMIDAKCISRGGLTETSADVRIMMREALMGQCTAMVLCHNHPSGNIRPSRADDQLTEKVHRACQVMNIKFVDHVVVTDGNYYSYNDEGKI